MPIIPPVLPAPAVSSSTRTANALMVEISGHLVEDIVNTSLTQPAAVSLPATPSTLFVTSTLAMYAGAQVVISQPDGTQPAIITILTFDPSTETCTAILPSAYSLGATLLGATFPTQQPSDPLFTQVEVLSYLARAQNEFLSKLPCIFQFTSQNIDLGVDYQALPANAIELERVSISGTRLYEISQSQATMEDPQWQFNTSRPTPRGWFEDRTGYYGWGLWPVPQAAFEAKLITSKRGPDALILTSGFEIPDTLLHGTKYLALAWMWQKAGEQRSPSMARIAMDHYTRTLAFATRYMDGVVNVQGKRGQ